MKIIETLGSKLEGAEKLEAVIKLVDSVRKEYGNSEVEITAVKVNSANGWVPVNLLTTDEKVAVAEGEIRSCISRATVVAETTEGAVFDRAFESFVATSPILTNLNQTSDSKY